jgi:hypothetical protein
VKDHVIREGLKARAFPNRKVSHAAIRPAQHVFAARHAVHTGLERLRRFVQGASGMAWIRSRARLKSVIVIFARGARLPFRVGKIGYRVTNG